MEQRPAAMVGLDARAGMSRSRPASRVVDLAEIMLQQDVFGRDRRIGLELEDPMPVGRCCKRHAARRAARSIASSSDGLCVSGMICNLSGSEIRPRSGLAQETVGGGESPSEWRLRSVAGRPVVGPVAGEHEIGPARRRPRAARQLRRRRGKGRALFLDDLPGRHRLGRQVKGARRRRATDSGASSSAGMSTSRSAALTVTESTSCLRNTHSATPPTRPTNQGASPRKATR